MSLDIELIDASHLAQELRETWQVRAIKATVLEPFGMVVLSVLAHSYDEPTPQCSNTWRSFMWAAFPGFIGITTPFLGSAGKIDKSGCIVADVVWDDFQPICKGEVLFRSTRDLEGRFRRLADRLKLKDADRIELFQAVKRWIVCDYRLDPAMDPADPDAKRLVH